MAELCHKSRGGGKFEQSYSHVICLTRDLIDHTVTQIQKRKSFLPIKWRNELYKHPNKEILQIINSLILARITSYWIIPPVTQNHCYLFICLRYSDIYSLSSSFLFFFCTATSEHFGQNQKATQLFSIYETTFVKVGSLILVEL